MSLQSAVQHLAAAMGAFLSAELLTELPDGSLGGIGQVAALSMVLMVAVPFVMHAVARRLRATQEPALGAVSTRT